MKKANDFRALTDRVCCVKGCDKKLKKNPVNRKKDGNHAKCYKHYKQARNKGLSRKDALRP